MNVTQSSHYVATPVDTILTSILCQDDMDSRIKELQSKLMMQAQGAQ
jgi:hypothetical protein